jgi:hypothetical protein
MPRGRPVGTTKRDEAKAAAQSVWDRQFDDVRSAAEHFRPSHIGSDEGFRNFVEHVEEEYRALIAETNAASYRRYKPLAERTLNRQSQTKPHLKYLREMLDIPDPI